MTDLLERLRRDDPSALEELGHELLPFVQAAVLSSRFEIRDPAALLQMFRDEVALATRSSADAASFFATVLSQVRSRVATLPPSRPDPSQVEGLARLALLEPLPVNEREVVVARFVERLPESLNKKHFGLETAALAAILSRGAVLLVGPAPGAADWTGEASLLDPDAVPPVAHFVELENVLTCLAIDVTALERQPVMSPVPVLKPGFEPQVPQEHYPSMVATQGFVDVPANVSSFSAAPPPLPSVVLSESIDNTPAATPLRALPLRDPDEYTEPQGVPLTLPPPVPTGELWNPVEPVESTVTNGKPLVPWGVESTETHGRPLVPPGVEPTVTNGKPLTFNGGVMPNRGRPIDDGQGYFSEPTSEQTQVGVLTAPPPVVPFNRRLPTVWWWSAAALCALLGTSLYLGMVNYVKAKVLRPWTMMPVVVAARDLPEGTKLMLEQLSVRAIPSQNASVSVVKPESIEYALGKTLEFPLQAGDPLLWAQFDGAWKYKRFAVMKKGRAYAVSVTELRSLGGNLMPNEEIDLVMTVSETPLNPKEKTVTRALTILQRVRVLAVGAVTTLNVGRVQRRFTNLTLMLVPEEVEVLSLAQRTGEITVTLRNSEDEDTIGRGETTMSTLLSGVRLKAIERKRGAVIATIRDQRR
jgi:pilus assembly protein CpaB